MQSARAATLRAGGLCGALAFGRLGRRSPPGLARCALALQTAPERFHEIDDITLRSRPRCRLDGLAGLPRLDQVDNGFLIAILELRRIEFASLRVDDVFGQSH